MLKTLLNIAFTLTCVFWYSIILLIILLVSRDRNLCFKMSISCVRDVFELWDCDIEEVIYRLNQQKRKRKG